MSDINNFAKLIAGESLTEIDTILALLWYCDNVDGRVEVAPGVLADLAHSLSLRGGINVSRLTRNMAKHEGVVKGQKPGTWRLKLAYSATLEKKYRGLVKPISPKIDALIVPDEIILSTRKYLERLATQINGSYQFGFYDGCAVLCRRLVESLLIDAFEAQGCGAAIKIGKEYIGLNDIIGLARSGNFIKLSRGLADALEQIKFFGDAAAHSRTHLTTQRDVDDIKMSYRRVLSELLILSKIEPRRKDN